MATTDKTKLYLDVDDENRMHRIIYRVFLRGAVSTFFKKNQDLDINHDSVCLNAGFTQISGLTENKCQFRLYQSVTSCYFFGNSIVDVIFGEK